MDEEIFTIQLNQNGITWLEKLFRLARLLFFLSLLISVISVANQLIMLGTPGFNPKNIADDTLRVQIYGSYAYTIVFWVLFPLQTYFYFKFFRKNKKAAETGDSRNFNDSFRILFFYSVISLVAFVFNLVYVVFSTYGAFILSKKI